MKTSTIILIIAGVLLLIIGVSQFSLLGSGPFITHINNLPVISVPAAWDDTITDTSCRQDLRYDNGRNQCAEQVITILPKDGINYSNIKKATMRITGYFSGQDELHVKINNNCTLGPEESVCTDREIFYGWFDNGCYKTGKRVYMYGSYRDEYLPKPEVLATIEAYGKPSCHISKSSGYPGPLLYQQYYGCAGKWYTRVPQTDCHWDKLDSMRFDEYDEYLDWQQGENSFGQVGEVDVTSFVSKNEPFTVTYQTDDTASFTNTENLLIIDEYVECLADTDCESNQLCFENKCEQKTKTCYKCDTTTYRIDAKTTLECPVGYSEEEPVCIKPLTWFDKVKLFFQRWFK
jgi:hypothetical protein